MESFEIKGNKRDNPGKSNSKKLRKEGNVPCVLYGGKENIHFHVTDKSIINLIYTPKVYIVKLDIDSKKYDAVIKEIQFHPVTDKVNHIDFYEIEMNKPINIGLPVKTYGDSEGIKQGGKLHIHAHRLLVKGLIKDLPDTLNIDITDLTLGKSLKVGELNFDNLELLDPKDNVVCSVKLTRISKADLEEELEEGEEEGAEEGAEGEAEAATEAQPNAEKSSE